MTKNRKNAFRIPSVEKLSDSLNRLSVKPPAASTATDGRDDPGGASGLDLLVRENDAVADDDPEGDDAVLALLFFLPRMIFPMEYIEVKESVELVSATDLAKGTVCPRSVAKLPIGTKCSSFGKA